MRNDNDINVIVEGEEEGQYNAKAPLRDDSSEEDFSKDDSRAEDGRSYSDPDEEDDEDDEDDEEESDNSSEESENQEIAALKQQISDNELRIRKSDLAAAKNELIGLENRYDYLVSEARKTQQIKAEAISSQQGEIVIQAEEYLQQLLNEARQIERIHKTAKETLNREENDIEYGGGSTSDRRSYDDSDLNRTRTYARQFQEDIGWNDLPIKTKRRIENLDNKLAAEGFSTSHPRYWQILKSRARKAGYLSDYDNQGESMRKGGPATASSSNNSGKNQHEQVYISKERKEALIAAGVWDDPHLRSRYVKRYQEWDRENSKST